MSIANKSALYQLSYSLIYMKEGDNLIKFVLYRLRSRHLLLGATVFQASSFDWDEMRASETDIIKYSQQIDNCKELTMVSLFIYNYKTSHRNV